MMTMGVSSARLTCWWCVAIVSLLHALACGGQRHLGGAAVAATAVDTTARTGTTNAGVGWADAGVAKVTESQLDRDAWEATNGFPAGMMQRFVEKKRTGNGTLFVFSNQDTLSDPTPCDVSVVVSYRERIDPVHQLVQTRLDQENVCHFHFIVILWDVPWAKHQVAAYWRVLEKRPGTTLLVHRGPLLCYLCLRNLALPYVTDTAFTLWADHGTLWKPDMLSLLVQTARTDPRNPVVVSPHVAETGANDGHVSLWGSTDTAIEQEDSHHPHTYIRLFRAKGSGVIGVKQHPHSLPTTEVANAWPTDFTEPHVYLSVNQFFSCIWPHYEPGGHARLHHHVSIPLLRKFGRQRQLAQVEAEAAYPGPDTAFEAPDVLTFIWKWEPISNIQSTHYTNAINGFLDLNFRCLHNDLLSRLRSMAPLHRFPKDPLLYTSLILAQLAVNFWNEFCFVEGSGVASATAPQRSPAAGDCKTWHPLSDALGLLPFYTHASGVAFRSNFGVLHSVPFNLTAGDALARRWDEPVRAISDAHMRRRATGKVETKCLERRIPLVVISNLNPQCPPHLRLSRRLAGLSSLVLKAHHPSGGTSLQLWLLLKTQPTEGQPIPLEAFGEPLNAVVSGINNHVRQRAGRNARMLHVTFLTPNGDKDVQYMLATSQLKVKQIGYHRVSLDELTDAIHPTSSWGM